MRAFLLEPRFLRAKFDLRVRPRICNIKGFSRTLIYPHHVPGVNPQYLHILMTAILGMVFDRRYLLHVRPRHVQATVSQSRGIHCSLRCVPGSSRSSCLAFTFAPWSRSSRETSRCPDCDAEYKGCPTPSITWIHLRAELDEQAYDIDVPIGRCSV
jgi:hypothetical protein